MKRLFILNLIFFLVLNSGCSIFNHCARENLGPKIAIEKIVFDAGNIKQGATISHTFLVANQGDEKLLIEKVKPG